MTSARRTISDRILGTFPSGTYCPNALLRVLDIVETNAVATAAIECRAQPRLLVNPEFVAKHAETDEKLLVLVLHELHHLLLGHTRLYPRPTQLDNIVFDAVINATLSRLLPQPEYTALFREIYDDTCFPECFLRPPDDWTPEAPPAIPPALRGKEHEALADLYQKLYSEHGCSYSELRKALSETQTPQDSGEEPLLLGDHRPETEGASSDGTLGSRAPVLLQQLKNTVDRWSGELYVGLGRGAGGPLVEQDLGRIGARNCRELRELLGKVADPRSGNLWRQSRTVPESIVTPIPGRARRTVVQRALGARPLLHPASLPITKHRMSGAPVHVYLDVSASMDSVLTPLYAALLSCRRFVHPHVHLFSTEVVDITLRQLARGVRMTTGGTHIDCVIAHMQSEDVDRAVLVTDGLVGHPRNPEGSAILQRAQLGVALSGSHRSFHDLAPFIDHKVELDVEANP
ncbi:MAG: hypothetical protein HRU14_15240 [Planctomycetes bacterium]|nr:hypothetical protein [Planctomycetota bacterium]